MGHLSILIVCFGIGWIISKINCPKLEEFITDEDCLTLEDYLEVSRYWRTLTREEKRMCIEWRKK